MRGGAGQRDLRDLARVDRGEVPRIEIARRLQRLAGPPENEEHAAAALLGQDAFLLQLVPSADDVITGGEAVAQRHVLRGERVHLLTDQVNTLTAENVFT